MAEITSLQEAVRELVRDGDTVALEGFTHLIPFAAGHEIVRQERRGLELVRMTPDLIYDQMIGMGCARRLVFSWGGNPGVGSLHRLRDAVENGWPDAARARGALPRRRWPTATRPAPRACPSRSCAATSGTDLEPRTNVAKVTCPFTGEELTAVPAMRPDVGIVHAQRADRPATSSCGGSSASRRRSCWRPSARW